MRWSLDRQELNINNSTLAVSMCFGTVSKVGSAEYPTMLRNNGKRSFAEYKWSGCLYRGLISSLITCRLAQLPTVLPDYGSSTSAECPINDLG